MREDLTEQKSKFNLIKLIFNIYIVSIFVAIFLAYSDVLPREISEFVVDRTPYSGKLIPVDENYINTIIIFNQISFFTGGIFSIAAGIVLSIKRDIFEILGIFLASMIPRERKYLGLVFDNESKKAIPFVPVRLYKNDLGLNLKIEDIEKLELTKQLITDLDGSYRMHVASENNYVLVAQAQGYKPVIKNLDKKYLKLSGNEIFEDLPLVRKNVKVNKLQSWFYFNKPVLSKYLLYYVYLGSILGTPLGIFALINNPIIINFIFVGVYSFSVIWNSVILFERRKRKSGKIISKETNKPIKNAIVKVYSEESRSTSQITDEIGLVKFEVSPGNYRVQISAQGFGIINTFVKINKDGYLGFDIKLNKVTKNALNSDLQNPFI